MPRKGQFRRLRRLRLVGTVGGLAVFIGGASVLSAWGDAFHHRPGGVVGVLVGLVLVASGIGGATWSIRAGGRVAAGERQELHARGLDDGLPMGAFVEGQRTGLEAPDLFWVLGTLLLGFGVLFSVAGATDPQVGWKVGIAFGSVGFLPAALFFRLGTGTTLWLTSEGIERSRWPRRSVRWVDVKRIVPLLSGKPISGFDTADAIELQLSPATQGWSHFSGVNDFTIRCQLLEISARELFPLIQEKLDPRRDVG
jgi:hypothetical protein